MAVMELLLAAVVALIGIAVIRDLARYLRDPDKDSDPFKNY